MRTDTAAKQKPAHKDHDAGIEARGISYSTGFRKIKGRPIWIIWWWRKQKRSVTNL